MSDPQKAKLPPQSAETARQEGAQGSLGKGPGDRIGNGLVDTSDPEAATEVAEVADQVHANA